MRGRLVGLHPEVPWTGALAVRAGNAESKLREHEDRVVVAADGTFTATSGKKGVCYPLGSQDRMEPFVEPITITPPAEVNFRLDGGIALVRVMREGAPVPDVAVTTDSIGDQLTATDSRRRTDARGEVRLLRSQRVVQRIVVEPPGEASRTVELPASCSMEQPLVIELPKSTMVPVLLELVGVRRVTRTLLTWRRLDAQAGRMFQSLARDRSDAPFRCAVPPGRYELTVAPPETDDLDADSFLIPVTQEVEVPEPGCELRINVVLGGRVRIVMTKPDGRLTSSFASLVGSAGLVSCNSGGPGAMGSANVPPGTWSLQLSSAAGWKHQETVEIKAGAVTGVRIRLP